MYNLIRFEEVFIFLRRGLLDIRNKILKINKKWAKVSFINPLNLILLSQ